MEVIYLLFFGIIEIVKNDGVIHPIRFNDGMSNELMLVMLIGGIAVIISMIERR